ncbi:MAG: endonuclease III [Bacteroidetes bacterium]|nr:endonuclease III [Bacteroidota bacterium]
MTIKQRYKFVIDWFKENMPIAETELHYNSPFELLVAVILSAQCTDKRVNIVTKSLFEEMPTAECFAESSVEVIYEYIKSISYPNNKAKNLFKMSHQLLDNFGGVVPEDIDNLLSLAGVGRKTANVIASVIYNKPMMAVDTHVFRVSARLGLVKNAKTPLETERQLTKNIPDELIPKAHHWLILHGRYVCTARNPKCEKCGLSPFCKAKETL